MGDLHDQRCSVYLVKHGSSLILARFLYGQHKVQQFGLHKMLRTLLLFWISFTDVLMQLRLS